MVDKNNVTYNIIARSKTLRNLYQKVVIISRLQTNPLKNKFYYNHIKENNNMIFLNAGKFYKINILSADGLQ